MLRFCKNSLKYIVSILFFFLSAVSLLQTQRHGMEKLGEIVNEAPIYKITDSPLPHMAGILLLVLVLLSLMHLHRKFPDSFLFCNRSLLIFQIVIACLSGVISFLILEGGTRTPIADQIQVYNAALCFNEDNYINLTPGGYVDMYPQQLGYILYLQLLFRLAGSSGFYLVQIANCIFIAGAVFGACLVLNDITEQPVPRILGPLLLLCLLPLYLLSSWVYGDVPFLFFTFLFIHFFLQTLKGGLRQTPLRTSSDCCQTNLSCISSGNRPDSLTPASEKNCKIIFILNFFLTCLTAVLCLLFRKNALILFIAAAIAALVSIPENRLRRCLAIAVCVCTVPLCTTFLLERHYENISGYKIRGGLPAIAWITMGTIEDGSTPGWFNNFSVPVYYEAEYNKEKTAEASVERLHKQLAYFAEKPLYAVSFYKRKICTQWNDPYFNTNVLIKVDETDEPTGLSLLLLQKTDSLRTLLSVLQSIVYLGTFCYIIFLPKDRKFYKSLPELFVLGGFLFSILWEANSRYIFPYYMACFPLAAIGWHQLLDRKYSLQKIKK